MAAYEFPKMLVQNARELQISSLFHYQRFKPDWLHQILFEHKIYFSNPSDFNDPWDCRPFFRIPAADDHEAHEKLIQWFALAFRRQHSPEFDEQDIARRVVQLREDRPLVESMIQQLSDSIMGVIHKEYRVYCVSTKPDSTLMWSHYSNDHKGVCLEFSCDNLIFAGALKVQYSEEYPLLNLTDNTIESGLLPLCSKSSVWNYESEYRVIAQEKIGVYPALRTRRNFIRYPCGALKAVIVGCRMPSSDADNLREILDQHFPRNTVELKRAVLTRSRYTLSIESAR